MPCTMSKGKKKNTPSKCILKTYLKCLARKLGTDIASVHATATESKSPVPTHMETPHRPDVHPLNLMIQARWKIACALAATAMIMPNTAWNPGKRRSRGSIRCSTCHCRIHVIKLRHATKSTKAQFRFKVIPKARAVAIRYLKIGLWECSNSTCSPYEKRITLAWTKIKKKVTEKACVQRKTSSLALHERLRLKLGSVIRFRRANVRKPPCDGDVHTAACCLESACHTSGLSY